MERVRLRRLEFDCVCRGSTFSIHADYFFDDHVQTFQCCNPSCGAIVALIGQELRVLIGREVRVETRRRPKAT